MKTFTTNIRTVLSVLALSTLAACNSGNDDRHEVPVTECIVKITPVKDQGDSSLCWLYAMLATIESDRIMMGDSVHLSPFYTVYCLLERQAEAAYLSRDEALLNQRAMAPYALRLIEDYGLTHYAAYNVRTADMSVLWRKVEKIVADAVNRRSGIATLRADVTRVLDADLRPKPRRVYLLGAEYTAAQFARSVCAPGDYVSLTSFTHHPFGECVKIEVPDNHSGETFLNVPIDTLEERVDAALRNGRAVCWEGDTSEPGFSFGRGYALVEHEEERVSQQERQKDFETFLTTDDHCMEIIGIARASHGGKYYICKNSWGRHNPFGGLMYMSENYLRRKTVAVVMRRE